MRVTSSPRELAADERSLRGVAHNLAAPVGTALVGALRVGILEIAALRMTAPARRVSEGAHAEASGWCIGCAALK
jgi:hypothetical protein